MALTTLTIRVANPGSLETAEPVELLVDSGAIYSVVPGAVLERLGIKPLTNEQFRLTDGSQISCRKGVAIFKDQDRIGGADVIFGEPNNGQLLGAFTLEALGLVLDPLRRELRPLPMVLSWSSPAAPSR